ncbi:hypothetical protein [Novosphingobium resinovorum]|nr:hypothetical protein [Novosphingobium resinovorum]
MPGTQPQMRIGGVAAQSRLSCQLAMTAALDGLRVVTAPEV